MRQEGWPTVTVWVLCLVAALLGAGLARERHASPYEPNPWVAPGGPRAGN